MRLKRIDLWMADAFALLMIVCIVLFCAGLVGAQTPAIAPPALEEQVSGLERRVSALERSASAKPIAQPADDPWARPDGFKAVDPRNLGQWRDVRSFDFSEGGAIRFYEPDGPYHYATRAWVNGRTMTPGEFGEWAARNVGRVQFKYKPNTYGEYEFQIKIPTGNPLRGLTSDELKQIDPWYRQSAAPVYSAPVVVQSAPLGYGWTGAAVTYNADGSVTTCSNGSCSTTPPQRRGWFRR